MNRTKIEWVRSENGSPGYTWNPVTGCWGPGGTAETPKRCWYCYAEKMAKRIAYMNPKHFDEYNRRDSWFEDPFQPTFFPDRLIMPSKVKKPSRIFVCSMGDLFGDWVPAEWIGRVRMATGRALWHTFIFLTKNPRRYAAFNPWPSNCWLGVTVTNQADADERIPELLKAQAPVRFVSVEPLLKLVDVSEFLVDCVSPATHVGDCPCWGIPLNWLIIGAMTGPGSKAHQPKPEWVQSLIDQARAAEVPVFLKDNLGWPEKIQEWPA